MESKSPMQMLGITFNFMQWETPLSAAIIISQDLKTSLIQGSIINAPPKTTIAFLGVFFTMLMVPP